MGIIENLRNEPIKIFFDEWKDKWVKLVLINFNSAKLFEIRTGKWYYKFLGCFLDNTQKNYFRIEERVLCEFHISKYCFDNEIQRHIAPDGLSSFDDKDLELEAKRTNNKKMQFRNVEMKEHTSNYYVTIKGKE